MYSQPKIYRLNPLLQEQFFVKALKNYLEQSFKTKH